jgi:hypothetical protein
MLRLCPIAPARSGPQSSPDSLPGEIDVRNNQGISTPRPITAIFWDALSAGSAMTALSRAGFSDTDVYAVGVLAGRAPDLKDFLDSLGIPAVDAVYYQDCFQDGAVLLIIAAQVSGVRRKALDVIVRHGGILPPSCELLRTAV